MPCNPRDACPDCGKPKSKAAARCRKCAGKHGYNRQPPPPPKPTGTCKCGNWRGSETIIGLDHEQITAILCKTCANRAYRNYEHHVKETMLDNLTKQIKIMTGH